MNGLNLHIYPSPFKFESRILRETKSIIGFNLAEEVIIASGWSQGLNEKEKIDNKRSVNRFRLFFDRFKKNSFISILKYFEFIIRIVFFYRCKKVNIVNCHSLFVLPAGYLLKLFNSKIWLIYDAHELESEKTGLNKISKTISTTLEKFLIKKVDKIIVVSPSIGKWYEKKYGRNDIVVIRNTPESSEQVERNHVFKDKFEIPDKALIFIYQGVVNRGRGIELLINTFSEISSNKHLVIMGYGPLVDYIKNAEKITPNIHFFPPVPPSQLFYYTSGADVGLSLIENISLSYYYCLPNKLFEYLHCGLPVIVSDFPDMSAIVNKFDCGWTTGVNKKEFSRILNNISDDQIIKKSNGVVKAQKEICWERESGLLFDAFPVVH